MMLSEYGNKNKIHNHFEALLTKKDIDKTKLEKIKEKLCYIKPESIDKEEEIEKCAV